MTRHQALFVLALALVLGINSAKGKQAPVCSRIRFGQPPTSPHFPPHSPLLAGDSSSFWKSIKLDPADLDSDVEDTPTAVNASVLAARAAANSNGGGRVAYGKYASVGQFPWMGRLIIKQGGSWSHYCGGTLIAPTYVLTAGKKIYIKNLFQVLRSLQAPQPS